MIAVVAARTVGFAAGDALAAPYLPAATIADHSGHRGPRLALPAVPGNIPAAEATSR